MSALLVIQFLMGILGVVYLVLGGHLWILARREREPLAARRAMQWGAAMALPHFFAPLLPAPALVSVAVPLLLFPLLGITAWCLKRGVPTQALATAEATERHDGRDIIFVRAKLEPGSPEYTDYYAKHPELREKDDAFRALPGLLHKDSAFYHPYSYAAARATFETIYFGLYHYVDHHRFARGVTPDPAGVSAYLKQWALHLGAHSVGISALRPVHLYTHGGYGDEYGVPTDTDHTYAISVTVEMDPMFTRMAPRPAEFLEVGKQYLAAATIATTLAGTIRQLGYSARAHVLDNHQVIQPLLARDAGLGEIGRMSILRPPPMGRACAWAPSPPISPSCRMRACRTQA